MFVDINANSNVGGFVGLASDGGNNTFSDIYYTGDITAKSANIGGIVGLIETSRVTFTNCHSKGKINSPVDYVGGIVGLSKGGNIGGMESCSHIGDISGKDFVGGLIGSTVNTATAPFLNTYKCTYTEYSKLYSDSSIAESISNVVKTEDIHPPKTGISVHFCVLSLMAMQK